MYTYLIILKYKKHYWPRQYITTNQLAIIYNKVSLVKKGQKSHNQSWKQKKYGHWGWTGFLTKINGSYLDAKSPFVTKYFNRYKHINNFTIPIFFFKKEY